MWRTSAGTIWQPLNGVTLGTARGEAAVAARDNIFVISGGRYESTLCVVQGKHTSNLLRTTSMSVST